MDSTRDGLIPDSDSSEFIEIGFDPPEFIDATSRYHLLQELGRGGMGVVYRARDLDLNRDVAIKILLREFVASCKAANQFINEARIMGMLQHPGIAHIYDYGTTESGQPFHAMKIVQGTTLAALLDERGTSIQLNAQLLSVFSHVCQTMAYTHSQHVIHLDLKPSNIMVGEFGEIHVMDWGLARSVDTIDYSLSSGRVRKNRRMADTEIKNGVHGTLQYMAPEQARGERVDKRTDVFCLGAILCQILTGFPPYWAKGRAKVLKMAREANLKPAFDRIDRSSKEETLVRLVKRCLQVDPTDRPWDATVLANEMVSYSESALERLRSDINQFFELSLDLFCIAGFDGYFRRINSNFTRVLGFSEHELLARPFISFVHPEDVQKTTDVMRKLLEGLPVVHFRNRYITKSREEIEFEWTAKSVVKENVIFAVARSIA